VTGQKVAEYSGAKEAGVHTITFNGDGMASGVYFYKLVAGDFSATKKMVSVEVVRSNSDPLPRKGESPSG